MWCQFTAALKVGFLCCFPLSSANPLSKKRVELSEGTGRDSLNGKELEEAK